MPNCRFNAKRASCLTFLGMPNGLGQYRAQRNRHLLTASQEDHANFKKWIGAQPNVSDLILHNGRRSAGPETLTVRPGAPIKGLASVGALRAVNLGVSRISDKL